MFRHSFDTKTRVLLEMIVQGGSIESVYHCCTYSLKVSGGFSGSNFKAVSKKKVCRSLVGGELQRRAIGVASFTLRSNLIGW